MLPGRSGKIYPGDTMAYTTNQTLLQRITEGDEVSWTTFCRIYSPLIRHSAKHWGLTPQETQELVQDVLINFFKVSKTFRYDRSKGRFRTYLGTITKNCIIAILKKRNREISVPQNDSPCFDVSFEKKWNAEWHNYLLYEAVEQLRFEMEDIAYQSFYDYVIREQNPAEVARKHNISVNAVYINKSRGLVLLRKIIKQNEPL